MPHTYILMDYSFNGAGTSKKLLKQFYSVLTY